MYSLLHEWIVCCQIRECMTFMPYAADSADISVSDKKWWHWLEPIEPNIFKFFDSHPLAAPWYNMVGDLKKFSAAFSYKFSFSSNISRIKKILHKSMQNFKGFECWCFIGIVVICKEMFYCSNILQLIRYRLFI